MMEWGSLSPDDWRLWEELMAARPDSESDESNLSLPDISIDEDQFELEMGEDLDVNLQAEIDYMAYQEDPFEADGLSENDQEDQDQDSSDQESDEVSLLRISNGLFFQYSTG